MTKELKTIRFKALDKKAIAPTHGSPYAACWDLYALEDTGFRPGEILLVRTGWACEVPKGYRTNLYVRSSTPLKKGFILANSVGIIDNDYRGELKIQLMNVKRQASNFAPEANMIKKGDKIAQIEVVPDLAQGFTSLIVDKLSDTERGEGGFGSTGD